MENNIIIYSTKTCGFCKSVKEYLDEHNITYTDIDVGENQDKAREMIEKSGQMGVPVTVINAGQENEEMIIGFDKEKIAGILGIED